MSLNEMAADLTCEPEDFVPAVTTAEELEPISGLPCTFPTSNEAHGLPNSTMKYHFPTDNSPLQPQIYQVHSGMLRMARAMGENGKPVHLAVLDALYRNPDYGAFLCFVLFFFLTSAGRTGLVRPQSRRWGCRFVGPHVG